MKNPCCQSDVLIIGGGLAGLMAALAARKENATVTLVVKGQVGKTGNSPIAGGGVAAYMGAPGDSAARHLADTITSGAGINDPRLTAAMTEEAGDAMRALMELGVSFVKDAQGTVLQYPIPGHSKSRSLRTGKGGFPMIEALNRAVAASGTQILENMCVMQLLKNAAGRVCGADACHMHTGLPVRLAAKTVILATGGLGGFFPLTSNSAELSGDGYAMALRSGAKLVDMEFIQFTPTALAYPDALRGVSTGGGILGQKRVRLLNILGERFMQKYAPDTMERSTRDVLARAIQREILEGRGTVHAGVYLDMTAIAEEDIYNLTGHFIRRMQQLGVDPLEEPLEIAPAMHFFMGGVCIDPTGATTVDGLFAAGEVAGGIHGANRLSSNGLTDAAVFGRIAGHAAARESQHVDFASTEQPLLDFTGTASQQSPEEEKVLTAVDTRFKHVMFAHGGIERRHDSLQEGVRMLDVLQHELHGASLMSTEARLQGHEIENKLLVGRAILYAALIRTESRGAHYRSDYPHPDNARWQKSIVLQLVAGEICFGHDCCSAMTTVPASDQ